MVRTIRFPAALAAFLLSAPALVATGSAPAEAVVYCKTVGVPKGCVARPTTVVYCTAVGVPKGCVARPATTVVVTPAPVVVAPSRVGNRGGPVNRVGRR